MRHITRPLALVAATLFLAAVHAGPAAAQAAEEEHWHPTWGDWSLAFDLPYGGGSGFGFWKQRSWNLTVGLVVAGSFTLVEQEEVAGSPDATQVRLRVGPALKRYWWQDAPVAPFFRLDLRGVYERAVAAGATSWRMGGGGGLGFGVDWFPAERVSIGGHTGMSADYLWQANNDDLANDATSLNVSLFTSGLTFHIYF